MRNRKRKMIAPAIITVLFVIYYLGIAVVFCMVSEIPAVVKVIFTAAPIGLAAVMVGAFVSRMREIEGGEEDDLSKY